MVRDKVGLFDYTLVDKVTVNGVTHLVDWYGRETLCGRPKTHKPTVWLAQAWGTGCPECQEVAILRLTEAFVREVLRFDQFVNGNGKP